MESRTLFAGAEGLTGLKAQMALAWHDCWHHDGTELNGEYFRGMVFGLAIADVADQEVTLGIQTFIADRGYELDPRLYLGVLDAGPSPTV
ncbi:UNVERIFIED_ORG: hypothetical protein ABIC62_005693 [Burkholderia sp. 1595]|uniref:Uncharacterized protein n=1 Tax=Paraburkholderia terricola TaxID=169427 RepID=A0ABU1LZP2_9BURK|nr:hypothetical protein [Paraburkholderia terricola]MDR6412231.1 hypothetical protein [Paraburkholderia terricola]